MAIRSARTTKAELNRPTCVVYARVSSKEQEKEGFSIPAQLKLLKGYAAVNGYSVVQEYIDVETAKRAGRTSFSEMVSLLKKQRTSKQFGEALKATKFQGDVLEWVTSALKSGHEDEKRYHNEAVASLQREYARVDFKNSIRAQTAPHRSVRRAETMVVYRYVRMVQLRDLRPARSVSLTHRARQRERRLEKPARAL